ncbi:hypothetical protein M0R45_017136 [Rubus argutus]|uniref:S-acyltransferase n=1 Tax=Rubus argutus TaxID=59490 RepID=A0AAW1XV35_RUBAR
MCLSHSKYKKKLRNLNESQKTMLETQNQSNPLSRSKLIGRYIVSCIFVFLTHLALSLIPRFFSVFSFLTQLVPFYISVNRPGFWFMRLRYCKTCKAYVKALDHHCPAFGTFIGQNTSPFLNSFAWIYHY